MYGKAKFASDGLTRRFVAERKAEAVDRYVADLNVGRDRDLVAINHGTQRQSIDLWRALSKRFGANERGAGHQPRCESAKRDRAAPADDFATTERQELKFV